jgi:hypothetical protein
VCPATLRDSTWHDFPEPFQLYVTSVSHQELARDLSAADDDDEIQELMETEGHTKPIPAYDLRRLRAAVRADRRLLHDLSRQAAGVTRDADPRLEELPMITKEADKEGIDDEDRRLKAKVFIFSFYEDTIDLIEEYLRERTERDDRLAVYRGRMASVTGKESRHGISREQAVHGFARARPGRRRPNRVSGATSMTCSCALTF